MLGIAPAAWALKDFPAYLTLPSDVILYDDGAVVREDDAEVDFPLHEGRVQTERGRHFRTYTRWPDADNKPAAETWAKWLPTLKAGGWEAVGDDGSTTYTLRHRAAGHDAWLKVGLGDYQQPVLDLIEVAAAAPATKLSPPSAQPERIGPEQDFPYLGKPVGATISGTAARDSPLDVTVGGVDRETQLVGGGYVEKTYTPPASLSKLAFESAYRQALADAGWTVKPLAPGTKAGEGTVIAQYARNGRNLWVVLGRGNDNGPTGLSMKIADLGAEDWVARLKKDCRLPLYGLHFDFDKATLRPDSTPILEKLLGVLQHDAALVVEVQGHTDDVGGDAYNLKLSDARAKTVVDWLVSRGIAAKRLSAKGYGLRNPVAPNDGDEGRAKNRRVEIVPAGCTAH